MLNGSTDQSNMVEIIQGREIRIQRMSNDAIHIDGEPFFMGKEINVSIVPLSLNIITPDYES
jgi:diacylglycerol kinase (ATP)